VSVWLPCVEPVALDATPVGRRLLLVDDDAALLGSVAHALRGVGYEVMVADGGLAALALLQEGPPPDLLIVDLGLRDMGGEAVVAAALRIAPKLPVLIATGATEKAADLGLPVLAKPFRIAELRAKVASLLRVAA
jgi:DNA-binding response OmpR family regulator